MKRVLFYAIRSLHLPHLDPIREWMEREGEGAEVAVSAPPYKPSAEGRPGIGLDRGTVARLQAQGARWIEPEAVQEWRPQVTVTADADFGSITWGGKIANVNHGLISKGYYYTSSPHVQRENGAHLICVPGPVHADALKGVVQRKVVATGLVKFDPIGRGEMTRETVRRELGVPVEAGVVTFAPTFNLELSAIPVVTDSLRQLVQREDRWLLLKLHGMTPANWVEMYRLLARLERRILMIETPDLTPALVAADVVISDVSSAMMEAVALDRPTVLVDNPLQKKYHGYNAGDLEYRWRDVGLRARSASETLAAVRRSFEHPGELAARRAEAGPRLVGPIDGRASERAGREILRLAGVRTAPAEAAP